MPVCRLDGSSIENKHKEQQRHRARDCRVLTKTLKMCASSHCFKRYVTFELKRW